MKGRLHAVLPGNKTISIEEKVLEFPIRYRGSQTVLRVKIFMDDVNAPDMAFVTDPKLAQEIEKEMARFANERGF